MRGFFTENEEVLDENEVLELLKAAKDTDMEVPITLAVSLGFAYCDNGLVCCYPDGSLISPKILERSLLTSTKK